MALFAVIAATKAAIVGHLVVGFSSNPCRLLVQLVPLPHSFLGYPGKLLYDPFLCLVLRHPRRHHGELGRPPFFAGLGFGPRRIGTASIVPVGGGPFDVLALGLLLAAAAAAAAVGGESAVGGAAVGADGRRVGRSRGGSCSIHRR